MTPDDSLKRKLTAIFFADVVGYSRLTGEDEEGTYRVVRDRLDLISESVQSHNGAVMARLPGTRHGHGSTIR